MKHIGWCLDQIQIEMGKIPRGIKSEEDKVLAKKILDEVKEYEDTLTQIILHPKFKESLKQLENSSIKEIQLQAHEIEELFKDLEHMLYVVDLYIKNLRELLVNDPDEWRSKAEQLVLMIDQKFGGEMGELRKEFEVVLHEEEELKKIVSSEKHLEEFLK